MRISTVFYYDLLVFSFQNFLKIKIFYLKKKKKQFFFLPVRSNSFGNVGSPCFLDLRPGPRTGLADISSFFFRRPMIMINLEKNSSDQ